MPDIDRLVHIVDDDEAIRHSVGFMLRKAGLEVLIYESGTLFLKAAHRNFKGCVLLDVRMPGLDGLEVQQRLSDAGIALPVIMLTGHGDIPLAVRAIKAGAVAFLEKPFERSALLEAIEEAFHQAERGHGGELAEAEAMVRLACLTARERQVLGGLVLGRLNKQIAFDLGIATRTVEVHRSNLMGKLNARSLSAVLKIAFAAKFG